MRHDNDTRPLGPPLTFVAHTGPAAAVASADTANEPLCYTSHLLFHCSPVALLLQDSNVEYWSIIVSYSSALLISERDDT